MLFLPCCCCLGIWAWYCFGFAGGERRFPGYLKSFSQSVQQYRTIHFIFLSKYFSITNAHMICNDGVQNLSERLEQEHKDDIPWSHKGVIWLAICGTAIVGKEMTLSKSNTKIVGKIVGDHLKFHHSNRRSSPRGSQLSSAPHYQPLLFYTLPKCRHQSYPRSSKIPCISQISPPGIVKISRREGGWKWH